MQGGWKAPAVIFTRSKAPLLLLSEDKRLLQSASRCAHRSVIASAGAGPRELLLPPFFQSCRHSRSAGRAELSPGKGSSGVRRSGGFGFFWVKPLERRSLGLGWQEPLLAQPGSIQAVIPGPWGRELHGGAAPGRFLGLPSPLHGLQLSWSSLAAWTLGRVLPDPS